MIAGSIEIQLMAGIARLQKDMDQARGVVNKATNDMARAANVAKNALMSLGAGLSLTAIIAQVSGAQRRFDVLNSSLITATGSVTNAAGAFKALSSFASSTPYALAEVTQAFVKLRNMGMDPSEAALKSYGNTAAAMGKSLNQMVEAVADAATGEFERLKEFGIKAKQNGDQVSLTFQGVSTTIGNNARDIEKYLQKLGETEFAGGMELRANTLDGAISNLGDTWGTTMLKFAQTGGGDIARESVIGITGALTDLTAILDAASVAADNEGDSVRKMGVIHRGLTTIFESVAVLGINIAYTFTQVGKELGGLAAQAKAVLSGDLAGAKRIGEMMRADAVQARKDVDARTAAILGASAKAQKAMTEEADTRKKTGADALAQFRIEQAAATETAEAAKKRIAAAKKAAAEYAASVKAAEGFIQSMKIEGSQLGLNAGQIRMMAAAREAAKAPTTALRMQIMSEALALDIATDAWEAKTQAEKLSTEATDSSNSVVNEINDQTAALIFKIKTYGMLPEAITAVRIAELEASKQSLVLTDAGIADIQRRIDALKGLAAAQVADTAQGKGLDVTKAKELLDILVAVDDATKSAAGSMADSFGRVGSAIGGLTVALSEYAVRQQAIAAQMVAAKADPKNGPEKIAKMEIAAAQASTQAKVKSYGDMAGAAKGFFKENSKGYKVMETAEKAYRAAEMAMAVETMLTKSGLTTAFTSLFVASKATETAATVATVPVTVAAEGVKQGVLATTAMAGAVAVPFPGNLVAVGIVAAMLAAIGLSSGGGGRPAATTYQDRQKKQGTGTVLGDDTAKSESISKSLEIMEKNSSLELGYQNSMLQALRNIESALGGAAKGIFQTAGLTGGSAFGTQNSSTKSFFGSDKSTTITDTGVRFTGSLGSLRAGGGSGTQYEDVTRTSDGGWFGGNKTRSSTNTKALSEAAMKPFTLIFDSMGELLVGAGVKLGADSASLNAAINQISIDFAVSTRDLKGQDLVDALSAGIGVAFDQVTAAVFPHMEKFQKVGEGMGETLVRVASEYSALDATLASVGMTFGAVGVNSLEARDRLIVLSGGIDKLAEQTSSFAENFLTEAERLAPIQKHVTEQLAAMGLSSIKTRDDFKAVVLGLQEGGALATKAGAETFAGLMALESAFAKVVPAIEAATDAVANQAEAARNAASTLMGNVDGAMGVLQRVIDAEKTRLGKAHEVTMKALQQRIDTETAGIAKHKALSDAIASTLGQMSISGNDGGNRVAAQAQITAALAMARAGAMPAADSLKGALSILSKDSSDMFSTMQDYQRDFYRTQNELAELGKLSDVALSVEEKTLAALIAQKDSAQAAYDAEIGRLDAVVESAQKQIDILNGIDTTGLTIVQALEAVRLAILSAQQNPVVSSGASINDAYKSALGRAPDAAGMEFFQNQAASGTPISAIVDAIKNSPEAKAQDLFRSVLGRTGDAGGIAFWTKALAGGMSEQAARDMMMQSDEYKKIPRFAGGGFHSGGVRAVGELGVEIEATGASRIHSTRDIISSLRNPSDSNGVLVAAVERLNATVDRQTEIINNQQAALDRIAGASKRTADGLEVVTDGFVAMRTKEEVA